MNHRREEAFTLIEMMIVIAIIGILGAIAIPNFLRFQSRAKFSECAENLSKIRQLNQAVQARYGDYCQTKPYPNLCPPGSVKGHWTSPAGGFDMLGFGAPSAVYFCYAIVPGAPAAPAAAGDAAANQAKDGATDCTLAFSSSTSSIVLVGGVPPDPGGAPSVHPVCTSDIDGDGIAASIFNTDLSAELIFDPIDAGSSTF